MGEVDKVLEDVWEITGSMHGLGTSINRTIHESLGDVWERAQTCLSKYSQTDTLRWRKGDHGSFYEIAWIKQGDELGCLLKFAVQQPSYTMCTSQRMNSGDLSDIIHHDKKWQPLQPGRCQACGLIIIQSTL